MRTRIEHISEQRVVYDENHWQLLKEKRRLGVIVLEYLNMYGINSFIFGSVARGDVHAKSDIEVIINSEAYLNRLEALLSQKFHIIEKQIIMATPTTSIKINYLLDNGVTVVSPFFPLTNLEQEFYKYGGQIFLPYASNYKYRVAGINKKFCLILPLEDGHLEIPVIGQEREVAKYLGVSLEIILERKKHLMERDEKGRTGVYLKITLTPEEDVYKVIKELADSDPVVRRYLKKRNIYYRVV